MNNNIKYKYPSTYSRKEIPFYINKSDEEFSHDPYERYYENVLPLAFNHLNKEIFIKSGLSLMYSEMLKMIPSQNLDYILDIGCGIGYLSSLFKEKFSEAYVTGLDYSYQMVKMAHDLWTKQKKIVLNLESKGFEHLEFIYDKEHEDLEFIVGDALHLPFVNGSMDLICSSFLMDRVVDPAKLFDEVSRVLKNGGQYIFANPLNFKQTRFWKEYYPLPKLQEAITSHGFTQIKGADIKVDLPMDGRGNSVLYQVHISSFVKN